MATLEEVLQQVDLLSRELLWRIPDIRKFDDYYRGKHNLRFASDQFKDYFSARYRDFADNWVQVVADAPVERLEVTGIRLPGEDARTGDEELWEWWLRNEADALSDMAFLDAVIGKRAYALVWGDAEGNPVITWEHPSQAIIDYDPETRRRRAALKLWRDGDTEYATLYTPEWVYKFERPAIDERGRTPSGIYLPQANGESGWSPRQPESDSTWPIPNPLGVVPMVEIQNRPRLLGEPQSDVSGTVSMQDSINLLWAYLFNTADYASFPQRVVTGAERPMMPILDDSGQVIGEKPVELKKFAVNRITWIEDENAKIHTWDAADLENFTKVIEVQVSHIAAQTRTPQHYLIGKMANLSGDALKAAETGLVKRTEEKTEFFGRGVREIFALVALVLNNPEKARQVRRGTVLWKDVESRTEAQLADSLLKLKQIGFPFEYLAEKYGLTPAEIERVMQMRDREAQTDPVALAGQMLMQPQPEET